MHILKKYELLNGLQIQLYRLAGEKGDRSFLLSATLPKPRKASPPADAAACQEERAAASERARRKRQADCAGPPYDG